jgi:putative flippase GtrA
LQLYQQAWRFVVSGGFLTLFGYAAILLLTQWAGMDPYWANGLVYLIGMLVSYGLHAKVVFAGEIGIASFFKFLLIFSIAYFANVWVLFISLDWARLAHWQAQLLASAAYSLIQFSLGRIYVFRRPNQRL